MSAPVILAIDTSTGACSAAGWKGGRVTALREAAYPVTQSARLMPMVEEALAASGIGYGDLTAVACTTGPGSFTGIRVGLSAAGGICFAAKLPGIGITTLEVMAFAARGETPVLAMLNAGKGECYYQGFDAGGTALFDAQVGTVEAALTALPGARAVGLAPAGNGEIPHADTLAALAAVKSLNVACPLAPFYIRAPDAKLPVKNI